MSQRKPEIEAAEDDSSSKSICSDSKPSEEQGQKSPKCSPQEEKELTKDSSDVKPGPSFGSSKSEQDVERKLKDRDTEYLKILKDTSSKSEQDVERKSRDRDTEYLKTLKDKDTDDPTKTPKKRSSPEDSLDSPSQVPKVPKMSSPMSSAMSSPISSTMSSPVTPKQQKGYRRHPFFAQTDGHVDPKSPLPSPMSSPTSSANLPAPLQQVVQKVWQSMQFDTSPVKKIDTPTATLPPLPPLLKSDPPPFKPPLKSDPTPFKSNLPFKSDSQPFKVDPAPFKPDPPCSNNSDVSSQPVPMPNLLPPSKPHSNQVGSQRVIGTLTATEEQQRPDDDQDMVEPPFIKQEPEDSPVNTGGESNFDLHAPEMKDQDSQSSQFTQTIKNEPEEVLAIGNNGVSATNQSKESFTSPSHQAPPPHSNASNIQTSSLSSQLPLSKMSQPPHPSTQASYPPSSQPPHPSLQTSLPSGPSHSSQPPCPSQPPRPQPPHTSSQQPQRYPLPNQPSQPPPVQPNLAPPSPHAQPATSHTAKMTPNTWGSPLRQETSVAPAAPLRPMTSSAPVRSMTPMARTAPKAPGAPGLTPAPPVAPAMTPAVSLATQPEIQQGNMIDPSDIRIASITPVSKSPQRSTLEMSPRGPSHSPEYQVSPLKSSIGKNSNGLSNHPKHFSRLQPQVTMENQNIRHSPLKSSSMSPNLAAEQKKSELTEKLHGIMSPCKENNQSLMKKPPNHANNQTATTSSPKPCPSPASTRTGMCNTSDIGI